jgi:hypothetical protein
MQLTDVRKHEVVQTDTGMQLTDVHWHAALERYIGIQIYRLTLA